MPVAIRAEHWRWGGTPRFISPGLCKTPTESDKAFETPLPFQTPSLQLLSEGSSRLARSGAGGRMLAPARVYNPRFCPINCLHILPQPRALGTAAEQQAQAGARQQHQQQNYPIKPPEWEGGRGEENLKEKRKNHTHKKKKKKRKK